MWLDLVQWPAMAVTSSRRGWWPRAPRTGARSGSGASSPATCCGWRGGLHDSAYALVALQFFLAALNARGIYKNE